MSDHAAAVRTPVTHRGEQAVQQRVGEGSPRHGSPMFGPDIAPAYAEFIAQRRMVVLGSLDETGAVWATQLTGDAGFAAPAGDTTLVFAAFPPDGDPLRHAFESERPSGMIALDPLNSRRVRANGAVRRHGDGLVMRTEQVLRNCAKYIQKRELAPEAAPSGTPGPAAVSSTRLTAYQQRWISGADTFFIASHSPEHGADASHRGGLPGFVTVTGERQLSWPDYKGNSFYMTFGNIELDPRCGLLFVDWENGHTLQVTGECHIDWRDRSAPGAKRAVHFAVQRVVQIENATSLRWRFLEYSSFNP
ncbi:pyridoxamine 5'-phosphate oxidase family protein [Streptomyces sp. CA-250714]|uniref:pyridoxamine 5'-phosphate oxidase family protein n=1 Tax=Streptomyces sp. CA-250714 TaxID=3240060 RepID=UPI003D91A7BE